MSNEEKYLEVKKKIRAVILKRTFKNLRQDDENRVEKVHHDEALFTAKVFFFFQIWNRGQVLTLKYYDT